MKPKTKRQKEVYELSKKLPAITDAQIKWAKENCYKHIGYNYGATIWCLSCNGNFKAKITENDTAICPHCGRSISIENTKIRTYAEYSYFSIITTYKGWQVIRHFQMHKIAKKNDYNFTAIQEIVQLWMNDKGETEVMSIKYNGMCWNYDASWCYGTDMEIRCQRKDSPLLLNDRFNLAPLHIYPKMKILPIIERNGFNKRYYDTYYSTFHLLLTDFRFETLYKNGQHELLRHRAKGYWRSLPHWNSIKIAIRHKYIVEDPSMWFDYLDLCEHYGLDLHSPHYVCPDNLKEVHDRLVERKKKEDRKEKLKLLLKDNENYIEAKRKYLGLCFISDDGDIVIKTIQDLQEMLDEGESMHHCVFANKYYAKNNSLILTAKDNNGVRLETIEVDLKTFNVIQSRSKFNGVSPQHDRIVSLVEKNMKKIKKIAVA